METIIILRAWMGPFNLFGIPVNAPLNPAGIFGCVVTILLLTGKARQPRFDPHPGPEQRKRDPASLILAGLVGLVLFYAWNQARYLNFLSDDFILVRIASQWNWNNLASVFTTPGGDGFFRPFGYVSLGLQSAWSGNDARSWHAWAIVLHGLNALLLANLAWRLGIHRKFVAVPAVFFFIHAANPEAVAWIASRFDLLATSFLLAGLIAFERAVSRVFPSGSVAGPPARTPGTGPTILWHAVALLCFTIAAYSKESAFVFPALAALVILALPRSQPIPLRRGIPHLIPASILAVILFTYRWLVLGGIGGYLDPASAEPTVFRLGFASTLKVLFVRLWTSLYLPINWSPYPRDGNGSLGWLVATALLFYVPALLWIAARARTSRLTWTALAGLGFSILPPLHLLGGSADLSGGRLLYLPLVWFSLFIASAVDSVPTDDADAGATHSHKTPASSTLLLASLAAILLFQITTLGRNLSFWTLASEAVQDACATAAIYPGLPAENLPLHIDGVPALANGFEECRELRRLPIEPPSAPPVPVSRLVWDPDHRTLQPLP